jgi:geranylgeranyl diphosphate synthase type I
VGKSLAGFLADQRARITAVDDALLPVADALEAFVLGGGKRLRPAFAYWGFRGAGGVDSEAVVATLSSLELVQASALIHDDVMDRSDTRRGEPAVHRRFAALHGGLGWRGDAEAFGSSAAILLGDLCLVWSDELLHGGGLDPRTLARARPVFDLMRTEVTVGQYLDVLTQATGEPSMERAGKVARYKSAKYTVERPLLLGAALAGAPPEVEAAYSAYGLPLGEAFQLRDDVLGVFGDPARTGKPAGDDLREGKRTYLVAAAYAAAGADERAELTARLGDRGLDAAGVERLREIITGTGALRRTEERIEQLTVSALAALSGVDLDAEAREVLTELAEAATHRRR